MKVGLTGNIGSGKSTIAKVFQALGWLVFNSDEVAKTAYQDENIKSQVIQLIGKNAYSNNQLNKTFVSEQIFGNKQLLLKLNNIIHPYVRNKFSLLVKENPNRMILKESALLFETDINKELDKIILVTANDSERLQRIRKRDGIAEELAQNKMNSQMAQQEKTKLADYIIENNNDSEVLPIILKIHNNLINKVD